MEQYSILLPDEKEKSYRFITVLVLLMNATGFAYLFLNEAGKATSGLCIFGFFLTVTYILMFFIKANSKYLSRFRPEISFILTGIIWMLLGKPVIGLIVLAFAVLGIYASRNKSVIFSTGKISYPSFPPRSFLWKDISNVILKGDVLTIDLKNNKLMQLLISRESADAVDEAEFNAFCRKCMKQVQP